MLLFKHCDEEVIFIYIEDIYLAQYIYSP